MRWSPAVLPAIAIFAAFSFGATCVKPPLSAVDRLPAEIRPIALPDANVARAIEVAASHPLPDLAEESTTGRIKTFSFSSADPLPALELVDLGSVNPPDPELMRWFLLQEAEPNPQSWRWLFGITASERTLSDSREVYCLIPKFPVFRWTYPLDFNVKKGTVQGVSLADHSSSISGGEIESFFRYVPLSWNYSRTRCIDCHSDLDSAYQLGEIVAPHTYTFQSNRLVEIEVTKIYYHFRELTGAVQGTLEIRRTYPDSSAPEKMLSHKERFANWKQFPEQKAIRFDEPLVIQYTGNLGLQFTEDLSVSASNKR